MPRSCRGWASRQSTPTATSTSGAILAHSRHILDWYTPSHIVHGFLFYGALWVVARGWTVDQRGIAALVIETAWEVIENTPWVINRYRDVTVSGDYVGDTVINSVFDLWAMLVGFWLASRLPIWLTVALAIALELGRAHRGPRQPHPQHPDAVLPGRGDPGLAGGVVTSPARGLPRC